jgi:hypothetical protein
MIAILPYFKLINVPFLHLGQNSGNLPCKPINIFRSQAVHTPQIAGIIAEKRENTMLINALIVSLLHQRHKAVPLLHT